MRGIVLTSVFWLCSTILATAQDPANVPVIGWLSPATTQSYHQPGPGNPGPQLLRDSLAKHGLIDGKNVRIDMRLAEGKLDRLPALAEALVREGATVILAFGEAAGRAAQARHQDAPYRLCRRRPGELWPRRQSGEAWQQHDGRKHPRDRTRRQEDRGAERVASGCQTFRRTQ